jgi:hypothetical protein
MFDVAPGGLVQVEVSKEPDVELDIADAGSDSEVGMIAVVLVVVPTEMVVREAAVKKK